MAFEFKRGKIHIPFGKKRSNPTIYSRFLAQKYTRSMLVQQDDLIIKNGYIG